MNFLIRTYLLFLYGWIILQIGCKEATVYDLVIENGRVMDPASQLDAPRNVGIIDGKIAAISEGALQGKKVINASGYVVSPGFIDLHAHGQTEEAFSYMVRDGVTTAFELEVGTADINAWYNERKSGQLINYGVSIGHIPVRMKVKKDEGYFVPSGPANTDPATEEEIVEMEALLQKGIDEGAVGVGFGMAYTPAATLEEFERMMTIVKEQEQCAFIHVRSGLGGVVEAIETAKKTGASLHVVHANSSGGKDLEAFLGHISTAKAEGFDVSTEAYPYEAGMTSIQSALFDEWEEWDDAQIAIHQWPLTGEFLNRESFAKYRREGGMIIIHERTESQTEMAILHPMTMIASDGLLAEGKGHPRTSGTYAKVLGKFVREGGKISLMDALKKMTLAPAQRLESIAPAMKQKGRLQVGADADITIFDPETVIDQATYTEPTLTSKGIPYVLVNGQIVVEQGELVEEGRAGKAIRGVLAQD